jgi:hypothetical protein
MSYTRFAIYYVPSDDHLASVGAAWLGWDVRTGAVTVQMDIVGLEQVTTTPRKYGFHGTLKPPFRLAQGHSLADLQTAIAGVACTVGPARCARLELQSLGHFLALVPGGDTEGLATLAAKFVTQLDRFRAGPSDAELTRRRAGGLTPAQDARLLAWGYPYVLDQFRFHITLTCGMAADDLALWHDIAAGVLLPLPAPFVIDKVALAGERHDGRFEVIRHYALTG